MAGKSSVADDLVFPSNVGTPLDPDNLVHYHFQPCLERAGLGRTELGVDVEPFD
jgi:hypothetical protein